jgi:hypothetical protein
MEVSGVNAVNEDKNKRTSRTRDGLHRLPSVNLSIPSPVISVWGPRSSHA